MGLSTFISHKAVKFASFISKGMKAMQKLCKLTHLQDGDVLKQGNDADNKLF